MTGGAYVLVADDAPDIVELVRISLERCGYEVGTVEDGQAVLDAAAQRVPDLFVLDVWMPHLNGIEVTRRLREEPATAGVPILVLTAAVHGSMLEEARAAGATATMRKPFGPPELVERVGELLGAGGNGNGNA